MNLLSGNIKFLRKTKGLTQGELGNKIGVNRAMIGSYEEGRAAPKLSLLQSLAYYFNVTIDDLINFDLSKYDSNKISGINKDTEGYSLRVISTIVDNNNNELITVVPVKATAGYLNGYSDPEFIENLPRFSLPIPELSREKTYRVFQIKGDSMEPIQSGSYIICEYVQNWEEIKDGSCNILITKEEGITYKRIYNKINETEEFLLKSDNPEYSSYSVHVNDVFEIWKALGFFSFSLPELEDLSVSKLSSLVMELKKDVDRLKSNKL